MVEQEELALSLRGLCKSYSGIQVLHRINLDIRRGEIHCLAGQNGAGKSTIIRAVSGVERLIAARLSWRADLYGSTIRTTVNARGSSLFIRSSASYRASRSLKTFFSATYRVAPAES